MSIKKYTKIGFHRNVYQEAYLISIKIDTFACWSGQESNTKWVKIVIFASLTGSLLKMDKLILGR